MTGLSLSSFLPLLVAALTGQLVGWWLRGRIGSARARCRQRAARPTGIAASPAPDTVEVMTTYLGESCVAGDLGIRTWTKIPGGALVQVGAGENAELHWTVRRDPGRRPAVPDRWSDIFITVMLERPLAHHHRKGEAVVVFPQRTLEPITTCPGCGAHLPHLLGERNTTRLIATINRECLPCGRTWTETA